MVKSMFSEQIHIVVCLTIALIVNVLEHMSMRVRISLSLSQALEDLF